MQRSFALILGVIVAALGLLMVWQASRSESIPEGRIVSVEEYVTEHIGALSPKKAELGGTFYVTSIEAEAGKGVVSYEDGHVSYTADFTYTVDEGHGGIEILTFSVRE